MELLKTFAEQAVIAVGSAETYRALQERTAALAQRNSEFGERIEHQSATIDVLKEMSASPDDPQPVFEKIVQRARAFFATPTPPDCSYFDGNVLHIGAHTQDETGSDAALAARAAGFRWHPIRTSAPAARSWRGRSSTFVT